MTAKYLLLKILDYGYYWSLPENENSKAAQMRLQQIEQLLDVFELSKKHVIAITDSVITINERYNHEDRVQYLTGITNFEYIKTGEFVNDRSIKRNEEVIAKALAVAKSVYANANVADAYFTPRGGDIDLLFSDLLEFRQEIYAITNPIWRLRSGYSLGWTYADYLKKQMRQAIIDNLAEIDDTLCLILDPRKREFSNEDINFKEVDLEKLDLEWFMGH